MAVFLKSNSTQYIISSGEIGAELWARPSITGAALPLKATDDGAGLGLLNVASSTGSSFYVRNTEYGTSNLPNYYWVISGILEIPTTVIGDPISAIPAKVVALGDGTGELTAGGGIAHDAVNAGYPVQIGGHAYSGTPTAVANGDRVRGWFNLAGALGIHDAGGSITVDGSVNASVTGTVTATLVHGEPIYSGTELVNVDQFGIMVGGWEASGGTFNFFETAKAADSITLAANNLFLTSSVLRAVNVSGLIDLLHADGSSTDTLATNTTGVLHSNAILRGWNGSTFSRVSALGNGSDSIAATSTGNLATLGYGYLWDNATSRWNRTRGDTTGGAYVHGAIASDAVDSGNPVKIGMLARTSHITAVASADRVVAVGNTVGFQGATLYQNNRSDTFTTTANGTTLGDGFTPFKFFGIQATATGGVTSWTVVLEGSLDNTTFTTILTHTNVTPGTGLMVWSTNASPVLYIRSRCSAITLGGGTNVVVNIIGVQ